MRAPIQRISKSSVPLNEAGKFISRATLIIAPTSLVGQWVNELQRNNSKRLNVLTFYGHTTRVLFAFCLLPLTLCYAQEQTDQKILILLHTIMMLS